MNQHAIEPENANPPRRPFPWHQLAAWLLVALVLNVLSIGPAFAVAYLKWGSPLGWPDWVGSTFNIVYTPVFWAAKVGPGFESVLWGYIDLCISAAEYIT